MSVSIVCSTSLYRQDLDHALERIASLGFNAVDLICVPGWDHVLPQRLADDFEVEANRVESLLSRHGMRAVAFNMAVPSPLERKDAATNRERIRQAEAIFRLARRLGADRGAFYPGFSGRPDNPPERPWEELLTDALVSFRELCDLADQYGVTVGPEPHFATPFQSIPETLRLLKEYPGLTLALDPSHFIMRGDTVEDLRPLVSRAHHIHLRDAMPGRMSVPAGEGAMDFVEFGRLLVDCRYNGAVAIELMGRDLEAAEPGFARIRTQLETGLTV